MRASISGVETAEADSCSRLCGRQVGRLAASRLRAAPWRRRARSRPRAVRACACSSWSLISPMPRRRVLAIGRLHVDVAQPEFLQPRLGFLELGLVDLDLLVDEDLGRVGVLAGGAQARLDEDRDQRLHDALRPVGVGSRIGQRVEVVARRALDLQRLHQRVDQRFLLGLGIGLQVEVGHAHELLDVRPADQRAAQHDDLLVDVGLHRQAGHQRLQDRLGVDVDARARLVLVGNAEHARRRRRWPPPRPPRARCQRNFHIPLARVRSVLTRSSMWKQPPVAGGATADGLPVARPERGAGTGSGVRRSSAG